MASQSFHHQLHFILIPLMSPGHLIPMIDMAKLLAQHGIIVTIVTTPLNTIRFNSIIQRAVESGLSIHLLQLEFPSLEAGLPPGCENMDKLPSRNLIKNFYHAANLLQKPFEVLFDKLQPRPSCIISGKNLPWTVNTACKFKIPRIFFDGMGCFSFSCTHKLEVSKVHETVSKCESFVIPGLPHRIELTKAQLPENLNPGSEDLTEVRDKLRAADNTADGIVINTFEGLETEYVKEYKKWLDSCERGSVIYACLGSICGLTGWQLIELGLGLEASNHGFIWVIRGGEKSEELERWILQEGFEERTKERGLLVRGWAPQVLILSHPAIGGFLTHCGWNSTLEGVSAGVPLVTCPLFAEQFYNEKLVVQVLGIGVCAGVEVAVTWGLENKSGLVMKRDKVKEAIERVMDKGEEGEERRNKARELGEVARNAIEKVTTPLNAARLQKVLAHAARFRLQIQLAEIKFPCQEAGLAEGCENFDMLPSMDLAIQLLQCN
ncbi:hypothetical protein Patl1_32256 [Pistacia atlantica]|uniref:Uncharacterized protein n=1 Tax=Pistacia atlantica TaxID=434234 RepID=A0ACC1AQ11_9ROSI|nr:hypothetical protein Patl1_32256 [Pistacia atlantica]